MAKINTLGKSFQHTFQTAKQAQDAALAKLQLTLECLEFVETGFGANSIEFIEERPDDRDSEVDLHYYTCDLKCGFLEIQSCIFDATTRSMWLPKHKLEKLKEKLSSNPNCLIAFVQVMKGLDDWIVRAVVLNRLHVDYFKDIEFNPSKVINRVATPCYIIPADDPAILDETSFLCYANIYLAPDPDLACTCPKLN